MITSARFSILIQIFLAIAYVFVVKQLLAQHFFTGPWIMHLLNVLLAMFLGLLVLFSVNFVILHKNYFCLGLLTSLAVVIYFFIYTLQGHIDQLLKGLIQSPQYLINMLLFASAPSIVGWVLQSR